MSGGRTVVLGFDALDARYLDAFADDLPNLTALRTRGGSAPLRSTFPPWTGSAWPSMYTGVGPDHHGVYDFFAHGSGYPDEASVVSRSDVHAPAIWDYLTAVDVPTVVLNVPVTHPADPIEGALVPGYLAPEETPGTPEGIREELSAAIGERYTIYSRGEFADDDAEKLSGYLELIRLRAAAARELLAGRDWELAIVQVQKTDAVFHNFDDRSAFRAVYRAADDLVGTVLEPLEEPNVVVCSDHGIGPVDGYKVYVNEVLRRHGFVEATADGDRVTLASRKPALVGADDGTDDGHAARLLSRVPAAMSAVGLAPGTVYSLAQRLGVGSALVDRLPRALTGAVGEDVDWRRSRAYCRSGSELGVRINLAGREPDGVVPEADYERTRDELIELLSRLTTPDGEPAFDFVRPREAVYGGPRTGDAPDVVFAPAGMNNVVATSLVGRRFVPVDAHDHKRHGVFAAAGPAFDGADVPAELSLTDVAPIAMAAAGRPVPERMTGTVPAGLVADHPGRTAYQDVQYGTASDQGAAGDDEVTDRLEDLGYL